MDSSSSGKFNLLDQLAEEFAERYRCGERPSLQEYAIRYPDLADDIRDLFPALVEVELPAADRPPPETGAAEVKAAPPLRELGDYRILRQIGRGGMGVVYEAEQVSLRRRVALKVLSAQTLGDTKGQERFRREARSAARLHHTNIVPVFEVGQEGDVCYYAMQLIQGQGLDEVVQEVRRLREMSGPHPRGAQPGTARVRPPAGSSPRAAAISKATQSLLTGHFEPPTQAAEDSPVPASRAASVPPIPLGLRDQPQALTTTSELGQGRSSLSGMHDHHGPYFRSVARLGQQTALALAHAHARGIVHRDIKPSNLLLDESGVVWVTDFGLAKTEDEDLTRTGDLPGTLRYMSPERFEGQCDARADVYALGLTLYEMLVLAPAFPASQRLHLLEQIRNQEPARPRAHDPRIPRDLETVVLKAIDKDPRRRYQSADDLAEDLRRFLVDEPIQARRTRWLERLGRWIRRNPVVAVLVAAVAVSLLLGTGVASFFALQANAYAGRVLEEKTIAEAAERRALEEKKIAEAAERGRREQLLEAIIDKARAKRYSGRVGQRFDTLAAIRQAIALARELGKPAEVFDELRNLAVAALALPDFQPAAKTWDGWPAGSHGLDFDPVALRQYARGDLQGNVSVRRLDDDVEVGRLPGNGEPREIRFGTDGRTLLLLGLESGNLERWKIGTRVSDKLMTVAAGAMLRQQSSDGRRLLLMHESPEVTRAEVIDLRSGTRCLEHSSPTEPAPNGNKSLFRASMSPDGRWLARVDGRYGTAASNTLLLFDLDTGKLAGQLLHPGNVFAPVWHPDSRTLAIGGWNSNEIYVWDVPSKKKLHTLRDQKGGEPFLAMSPSGQLLTSSSGWAPGQVFWHPHTGKPLMRTLSPHYLDKSVQDGRVYRCVIEKTKITLSIAEPSPVFRTFVPDSPGPANNDGCRDVSIHPSGRLLAVGHFTDVSLFDLATGLEIGRLNLGLNPHLRFDPSSGDLLTYGVRGLFRWPVRIAPGSPDVVVVGPPRMLGLGSSRSDARLDVSGDGKVIVVANYTQAVVYRQEGDSLRAIPLGPLLDTRIVRVSPDGRWALTVQHATSEGLIWDARTGQRVAKIPGAIFNPDGTSLMAHRQPWKVGTWEKARPLPLPEGAGALVFSPNGAIFVGQVNDEAVHLVDAATGKTLVQLGLPEQSRAWYATFSPDGTQFIHQAVDHHYVCAWDLRALRRHLAGLGLDWDAPPFPQAPEGDRHLPPVVKVEPIDPSQTPEATVESASVWLKRGREHAKLGQWDEAVAVCIKAIALLPDDTHPWSTRSRICALLAEREDSFAKAIELRPDDAGLWLARGRYHARKGLWEKAAVAYAKAIASPAGEDYDLHVFIEQASAQVLAGDSKGYVATCTKLRERFGQTKDPTTAYIVGRTCGLGPTSGTAPAEVVKLAKRALAGKLPDKNYEAASFNVLGLAHYRAGQFEEAVRRLNHSLGAAPDWIGTSLNWPVLALAHHRLGHHDQARKWLEKSRAWFDQVARDLAKEQVGFPKKVHPADWLELQVLHREAETLLQKDKSSPKE